MSESPAAEHRFAVHGRHQAHPHDHIVLGRSFEDAALGFVEDWHPAMDADGEVAVVVRDLETGAEQCFRIDLDSGTAGPCE